MKIPELKFIFRNKKEPFQRKIILSIYRYNWRLNLVKQCLKNKSTFLQHCFELVKFSSGNVLRWMKIHGDITWCMDTKHMFMCERYIGGKPLHWSCVPLPPVCGPLAHECLDPDRSFQGWLITVTRIIYENNKLKKLGMGILVYNYDLFLIGNIFTMVHFVTGQMTIFDKLGDYSW